MLRIIERLYEKNGKELHNNMAALHTIRPRGILCTGCLCFFSILTPLPVFADTGQISQENSNFFVMVPEEKPDAKKAVAAPAVTTQKTTSGAQKNTLNMFTATDPAAERTSNFFVIVPEEKPAAKKTENAPAVAERETPATTPENKLSVLAPAAGKVPPTPEVVPVMEAKHVLAVPPPTAKSLGMLAPAAGKVPAAVKDGPPPPDIPELAPTLEIADIPPPTPVKGIKEPPATERIPYDSKKNTGDSAAVPADKIAGDDKKPKAETKEREDIKPLVTGYSAFKQFLSESEGILALNVSEYSQQPNVMEPIRLDEAVAFALKNNLEIKASNSRTKSAALEKMTAYSRLLPSLDFKLSRGSEDSAPASYNDLFGNRVLDDKHIRKDRAVAVRLPLIDLEVVSDILTSTDKESLAKIQDRDERDAIVYDTVNVYLKLVQARLAVNLADQYHAHLQELYDHMKARVDGGGATAGDLERIKGHANLAEVARAEALGEYETNLAEFRRLTQITPAQLQISEVLVPEIPKSLPAAIEKALTNNPAYLAIQAQSDIAASSRNSSFSRAIPKLSLEYSDTHSYDAGGAAKGNPVDGVYPTQDDKRLLLVAHWSLNGGLEIGEGMTALEKERETNFRSLDARSRIEEGVRASYNAINAANQRVAILQSGVTSNEKVVWEFEDQYKNGSRSIFELLDAHAQLYGNRVNLMRIEIARALAAYQVRRQTGDLLMALIDQEHSAKKEN